ncbi:MAG: DUF6161 domain-containing protein [Bacteroidales bacterium]|nr:DUF6161 domain-containing protein [Bacteroidales bacterium]
MQNIIAMEIVSMLNNQERAIIKKNDGGITYNFEIDYLGISLELKDFDQIYSFFQSQKNGWQSFEDAHKYFDYSKQYFLAAADSIEQFKKGLINRINQNNIDDITFLWNNTFQSLKKASGQYLFTFDSPYTIFLNDLSKKFPGYLDGAYEFIIKKLNLSNSNGNRGYFIGANIAYEFMFGKQNFEGFSRSNYELDSFSKIKDKLNVLYSINNNLFRELNIKFEDSLNSLKSENIDIQKAHQEELTNFIIQTTKNNQVITEELIERLGILETTYREKLKLEAPAVQWENRATDLYKKAIRFLWGFIILSALSALSIYALLWLSPEGMLLNFFKDDLKALRWSVVFITFISFIAFAIRAFYKISMSNFHLARDAEERKQLTYLYLALVQDSKIDTEERKLVLQSLFSRADTGLLKEDSSPTMPSGIIGKFSSTN